MFDYNNAFHVYGEETLAGEEYNYLIQSLIWDMWGRQSEWCSAPALAGGNPRVRSLDLFDEIFCDEWDKITAWIREEALANLLLVQLNDNVDLDDDSLIYLCQFYDCENESELRDFAREKLEI